MRLRTTLPLLAAMATASVASAQDGLPDEIRVGNGHMTVGFELKTTTHGDGPDGRTTSHTAMRYVRPVASASWTAEEKAVVDRWESLSIKDRTAFFFKAYKGGYTSSNFEANVDKYPFLDKAVSWYKDMGLPHIELRSKPYDSPKQATADMAKLKADVPETIAFHTHVRFPDTATPENAEAIAEYMRRVSWAIWLRRADYSSKTDFVLKSMDNQPANLDEIEKARKAFADPSPYPQRDIIERRGIRVSRLSGGPDGSNLIDIEFRGLTKDIGRIKKYVKLTGDMFGEGGRGIGPWKLDASSPFRGHDSAGKIQFRTWGSARDGKWNANELTYMSDKLAALAAEHGVASNLSEADLKAAFKNLATADTEAGKKMLLPSAFQFLWNPIEYDPALPEGVQAQVANQKGVYLKKLVKLAERVHAGEFGTPGQSDYQPLKTASRVRRILHDYLNESYKDGGKEGKLLDWYETSLFEPEKVVEATERYRRDTGKNRAAEWAASHPTEGDGFGPRRARDTRRDGRLGSRRFWTEALMRQVFDETKAQVLKRAAEEGRDARTARATSLRYEGTNANEVDARYVSRGNFVNITDGFMKTLDARALELHPNMRTEFITKALGLVFGHELTHATGIKGEAIADREGLAAYNNTKLTDPLTRADVARIMGAVQTGKVSPLERLKAWGRYGTEAGRRKALESAARGEADKLAEFRRADGTLDWKKIGAERAKAEALGLGQFGMALFLKELAVVAKTGDRLRIEEFFEGLLTTDFYKQYGLFVLGARASEAAYARYLQKFVRPRFVSSILKTNLALAAGLALPQIVDGTFSGKAFAISLGSLGLSSAAVRAAVAPLRWVYDLRKAQKAGTLARLGFESSKLARVGGWFYTAAELAVVLYLADEIGQRVNDALDTKAARDAVGKAGDELAKVLGDPKATEAQVGAAAEKLHAAYGAWRDFLYKPLHQEEVRFAARLEKAAERAKKLADQRAAALNRIKEHPALKASIERRYGSLDRYAQALVAKDEAAIQRDLDAASKAYARSREQLFDGVYTDHRRPKKMLVGVDDLTWALRGGRADDPADPFDGRNDVFANLGRDRARAKLTSAIRGVSSNRLQAYEDEKAVLEAALVALGDRRSKLGDPLRSLMGKVDKTRAAEIKLTKGGAGVIDLSNTGGLEGAVRGASGR